uniref:Uncharacterized protein n=1 Tax=Parascaris equorum TaxID=6256 RepID=A0A914R0X1_PAREQ
MKKARIQDLDPQKESIFKNAMTYEEFYNLMDVHSFNPLSIKLVVVTSLGYYTEPRVSTLHCYHSLLK